MNWLNDYMSKQLGLFFYEQPYKTIDIDELKRLQPSNLYVRSIIKAKFYHIKPDCIDYYHNLPKVLILKDINKWYADFLLKKPSHISLTSLDVVCKSCPPYSIFQRVGFIQCDDYVVGISIYIDCSDHETFFEFTITDISNDNDLVYSSAKAFRFYNLVQECDVIDVLNQYGIDANMVRPLLDWYNSQLFIINAK